MADSQSPLGACAVERDFKVGPQANAKATVLHRERMGECPSSNANRTRSQRHGSTCNSWSIRHPTELNSKRRRNSSHQEHAIRISGVCPGSRNLSTFLCL